MELLEIKSSYKLVTLLNVFRNWTTISQNKNNLLNTSPFSSFNIAMSMDSRKSYYYLFLLFSYYFYDIKYVVVLCHKQNETQHQFCKAIKKYNNLTFQSRFSSFFSFLIELEKQQKNTINMMKNFSLFSYFLFADDFDIFFLWF